MDDDSCSRGHGFESQRCKLYRILTSILIPTRWAAKPIRSKYFTSEHPFKFDHKSLFFTVADCQISYGLKMTQIMSKLLDRIFLLFVCHFVCEWPDATATPAALATTTTATTAAATTTTWIIHLNPSLSLSLSYSLSVCQTKCYSSEKKKPSLNISLSLT